MQARIAAVANYLPEGLLTNEDLAAEYPDWSVEKIADKTGIDVRHKAAADEYTSDLAVRAAENLFAQGVDRDSIDAVMLCTQSPDYMLPTNACVIQDRLGLRKDLPAFDYNLGCSGYVTGLGLCKGLIYSGQAKNILLLTGDTYTRYILPDDRSVRTLFGDAATATLVSADDSVAGGDLQHFVYGTDGSGATNLHLTGCGMNGKPLHEASDRGMDQPALYMDGPEIFAFTLRTIPKSLKRLHAETGVAPDEVDCWVFHQANQYMLDHLRRKLRIPEEKFIIEMADVGNTVSSTIPIALSRALQGGRIKSGMKVVLLGFGVGYSWTGALVQW